MQEFLQIVQKAEKFSWLHLMVTNWTDISVSTLQDVMQDRARMCAFMSILNHAYAYLLLICMDDFLHSSHNNAITLNMLVKSNLPTVQVRSLWTQSQAY